MKFIRVLLVLAVIGLAVWIILIKTTPTSNQVTSHEVLIERIESMGKLELVKYRFSDVIEHKNISTYLPDASVLLIIKAEAVGCIDLTKLNKDRIEVQGDSVTIQLPKPQVCYVKIDHESSKVYDTKMAFFRESTLVDEAYKSAEREIKKEVDKSDILQQTQTNASNVFKPLLEGLGFKHFRLTFEQ